MIEIYWTIYQTFHSTFITRQLLAPAPLDFFILPCGCASTVGLYIIHVDVNHWNLTVFDPCHSKNHTWYIHILAKIYGYIWMKIKIFYKALKLSLSEKALALKLFSFNFVLTFTFSYTWSIEPFSEKTNFHRKRERKKERKVQLWSQTLIIFSTQPLYNCL